MEDLPTEILQQICWFSLNPELYLVSKMITSKLPNLRQFETDVAAVLFCDRSPGSAWIDVDPFPWQTSQAATSNYALSTDERRNLQQLILTQSWFSQQKFRHLATRLFRLWLDRQWIMIDMPAETNKAIQDYLESGLFEAPSTFHDKHGNTLWSSGHGYMAMTKCGTFGAQAKDVFEVLCYPLKLFTGRRSPSKLRFFWLFRDFMPRHQADRPAPPVSHPQSAVRKALNSVVVDGDEEWFRVLYPLAFSSEVGIAVHQLVHEVLVAILSGRKWKLMEVICGCTRLPADCLESQLVPAVT